MAFPPLPRMEKVDPKGEFLILLEYKRTGPPEEELVKPLRNPGM